MPEEKEYDVIIIGGGPAGSTAGRLLTSLGHRTVIIDRQKFPREKLCGGLTTHKTIMLLERIFKVTEKSLIEKGIINYVAKNFEIRFRNRFLFRNSGDMLFYFVDRETYDNFLLEEAVRAGADAVLGEKVTECDIDNNIVTTSAGNRFKGRYIIAADGVNSIVRKQFPKSQYNHRRWQRNLISAFEIFVSRDDLKEGPMGKDADRPYIFLGGLNLGFSWIFPRKERVSVGIGALYKRNRGSIRDIFHKFLQEHGIDPARYSIETHNLPGGYYLTRPVYKKVLLAGDAGGFVDPLLGEGIFYSQRTAELASWTIHRNITEGRPLDKVYRKLLWKYVFPEFFDEKIVRTFVFYISEKLGHFPIKFAFNLLGSLFQDVLHGTRTNRGFFKRSIHESVSLNKISTFLTRPPRKNGK